MSFPTIEFAAFFVVVFIVSWALMPHPRAWRPFILIASYVFYGWVDWRWVLLLIASSVVNTFAARVIARSESQVTRKRALVAAVAFDLGLLGTFKYFGFFVDEFNSLLDGVGLGSPLPIVQIVLPIGISFFTFQAISYVVDVYRGETRAASLGDVAILQAFFPHLVAGPIVRANELLPQLRTPRDPRAVLAGPGLFLIAGGLIKKTVVADELARRVVDPVYNDPVAHSGGEILLAFYAFAAQIYCDFSGYTDMAIGTALLLGFQLPQNFNRPYAALSLQDFWRRWHITLSRWLRDYLYIPLGGNRKGERKTYRNLMITMLLGGFWHGASFTFLIWGGIHGTALSVERWGRQTLPELPDAGLRRVVRDLQCRVRCLGLLPRPQPRHGVRHPRRDRALRPVAARDAPYGVPGGGGDRRAVPPPGRVAARGVLARRTARGLPGHRHRRADRRRRRRGGPAGRRAVHLLPVLSHGPKRNRDLMMPAGRVLGVMLIALGIAALFNSEAIVRAGEGMQQGTTRDVVLSVARPLDDVAGTIGLHLPREGLDLAFGQEDKTASGTELEEGSTAILRRGGDGEQQQAARVPPAHAGNPIEVLVTGDSEAEFLGQRMTDQAKPGLLEVETVAQNATGLTNPDFFNWEINAQQEMDDSDPDAVVMAIGGNDGFNVEAGGQLYGPGDPGWQTEFARRVAVVAKTFSGERRAAGLLGAAADRARQRPERDLRNPEPGGGAGRGRGAGTSLRGRLLDARGRQVHGQPEDRRAQGARPPVGRGPLHPRGRGRAGAARPRGDGEGLPRARRGRGRP